MYSRDSSRKGSENAKRRPRRVRLLAGGLLLAGLLALPAHAGDSAGDSTVCWWQILLGAFAQATLGEEPEGGLSIEPGG